MRAATNLKLNTHHPGTPSLTGYEVKGDKYYRLYTTSAEQADFFSAARTCEAVGARLAMFKTQADFDIVKQYRGELEMQVDPRGPRG